MIQRQRKTKVPCLGCFLHLSRCICHLIPSLITRTKLTLIVHAKELKRTTNTGRLALKSLQNSEMRVRGQTRSPVDLTDLISQDYHTLLFFPSDEASELTIEYIQSISKPVHLLVPDGSWRQASKVATRHQELKQVPRVMISKPNLGIRHLRAESFAEGMSTLEAIAEAYRILEGEAVFQSLKKVYQAKLENTLRGRGQLNDLIEPTFF